jgi:hypothetical protein
MNSSPSILSDYTAFHDALASAGSVIRGKSCTCIWHDDKTPSCTIGQGDDGTWRMYCHACDRHASLTDLIAHASGKEPRQVFRDLADRDRPVAAKHIAAVFGAVPLVIDNAQDYRGPTPPTAPAPVVVLETADGAGLVTRPLG